MLNGQHEILFNVSTFEFQKGTKQINKTSFVKIKRFNLTFVYLFISFNIYLLIFYFINAIIFYFTYKKVIQ